MSHLPGSPSPTPAGPALSRLAVTTMAALYEAELYAEMEAVRARLLARGAELFEQVPGAGGTSHLEYRPMAELVLTHIREVVLSERPLEERRFEVQWALEMAGF
jgi:hypothetical protein